MATKELPDVRAGDVWQDNDPRLPKDTPRLLEVIEAVSRRGEPTKVRCMCNGRIVEIRQERFRPTQTGYKLVRRDGKPVEN